MSLIEIVYKSVFLLVISLSAGLFKNVLLIYLELQKSVFNIQRTVGLHLHYDTHYFNTIFL